MSQSSEIYSVNVLESLGVNPIDVLEKERCSFCCGAGIFWKSPEDCNKRDEYMAFQCKYCQVIIWKYGGDYDLTFRAGDVCGKIDNGIIHCSSNKIRNAENCVAIFVNMNRKKNGIRHTFRIETKNPDITLPCFEVIPDFWKIVLEFLPEKSEKYINDKTETFVKIAKIENAPCVD